jgi:hypothetical protein
MASKSVEERNGERNVIISEKRENGNMSAESDVISWRKNENGANGAKENANRNESENINRRSENIYAIINGENVEIESSKA